MNHALISQKIEAILNLPPDPIFGEINRIESYFNNVKKYRGNFVVAMKTHAIRTLILKGYPRKRIQKALDIDHSTICYHLDRKLLDFEEEFIDKFMEHCIFYSLVPYTRPSVDGIPQYIFIPLS